MSSPGVSASVCTANPVKAITRAKSPRGGDRPADRRGWSAHCCQSNSDLQPLRMAPFSRQAVHFVVLAALAFSRVCCIPVGTDGNTTLTNYREQKASVIFPPDSRGSSEWSRYSPSNLSRATASDDPFVFPDELPKKSKYTPMMSKRSPACAKGSTFCESIDGYPGDYLANVLSNKVDEFQAILGVDEVKDSGIGHRIDGLDENPLCASIEQVVYPKTAKTKEDKWLYVVNQGPYTQGVRIEKCLKNSDSGSMPCEFTEQFPLGYKTMCKQKYIYRKLVALDEDGKPITDTFQLPSCCSCTVKTESLRARIGSMRHPTSPATTTPKSKKKNR